MIALKLSAAALFAAILVTTAVAQDPPKPPPKADRFDKPPRIAVVNLADLFDKDKSERWKDHTTTIEIMKSGIEKEITELTAKARGVQDGLKALTDRKSPLYFKKLEELELLKAEIETKEKVAKNRLLSKAAELQITYYETNIHNAIKALAAEFKLDLVLRLEEAPAGGDEKAEDIMRRINQRVVLTHNPSLDITKEVIEKLNEEFRKEKGPVPAAEFDCPKCKAKTKVKDGKCEKCGEPKK